MGRKKKSDFVDAVEPMKDNTMNLPCENADEVSEKVSENVDTEKVDVVESMKDNTLNPPSENFNEVSEKVSKNVDTEKVHVVQEPVKEKIDEITLEPLTSVPRKMKINSSSTFVNIRENPDGEVMFFLKNNTPILVEEEHDGWCKVSGWVMSALVCDR